MSRPIRFALPAVTAFWGLVMVSAFGGAIGLFLVDQAGAASIIFWAVLDNFYVGCAEEAMFRYLLMDLLLIKRLKLTPRVALVASSVAFGLTHYLNGPGSTPQVCEAMAMGGVLGLLYQRYGLWAPILLHASFNFFVLFVIPVLSGHGPM